jgi:hypothetical protein
VIAAEKSLTNDGHEDGLPPRTDDPSCQHISLAATLVGMGPSSRRIHEHAAGVLFEELRCLQLEQQVTTGS